MATNHEAVLTVKAQVADAQQKMHALETQVQKLEKALEKKNLAADRASKSIQSAGASLSKMGGMAVVAASQGFQLIGQLEQMAREYQANGAVAANYRGDLDKLRTSVKGTVDDISLMRLSNSAMSLGVVKSAAEMEAYAAAAKKVGASVGLDTVSSLESLNAALGRGSTEMLDNLGIVMKKSDAEREYALQLGKAASQLTEVEKAEAFRVIGMQKIVQKAESLNDATSETGDNIAWLSSTFKNGANEVLNLGTHLADFVVELESYGAMMGWWTEEQSGFFTRWRAQANAFDNALGPMFKLRQELQAQADQAKATQNSWFNLGKEIESVYSAATYRQGKTGSPVEILAGMAFNAAGKSGFAFDPAKGEKKRRGGRGRGQRMVAGDNINAVSAYMDIDNERERMGLVNAEGRVKLAEQSLALAEAQNASLERQWQLQTQLFEAEIERVEQQLAGASSPEEVIALQEEREQMIFERQVERAEYQIALSAKRAAAEEAAARRIQEAHQRTATAINNASSLSGTAIQGVADIASTAAEQHGQSAEDAERKRRAWGAAILAVDAIFYAAKAAAAFAALNPIEGAGFLLAATISGAKAAQMGASVSGVGAGGGGGTSPGFQDRGPRARETRDAPSSKVPGSQGASPAALPAGGAPTGGTVVYVNTQVLGAIDDESAVKISRGLENAMRSGRVKMGRPS